MLTKFLLVVAGLSIAPAALAQTAATSSAPVTASAAKKAHSLAFAGGGLLDILEVDAGPNDTLAAVEVVDEGSRGVNVPGNTISAGDKPGRLQTSLTLKDIAQR